MDASKTVDPLDVVDEVRERMCEQCGKVLNKRQARFCSRACYGEWQSDEYHRELERERWAELMDVELEQSSPYEDDMDTPIDEDEE